MEKDYKRLKIASHNTMSYLTPAKWYMRPFAFVGKCQSLNIFKQYALGVRMFDLRVTFDKYGIPVFAHGHIVYKNSFVEGILSAINKWGNCYVRLILEDNSYNDKHDYYFRVYAQVWVTKYKNIKFFGCNRKYDWYKYNINGLVPEPKYTQKISSMTGSKLDDWWPRLYAMFNNKKNIAAIEEGDLNEWTFIDFIGKY